ncbi:MAG TPA: hypothetical protein DHV62_04810, partial [Elusimicrobia bacterium]|nr:hypothetical protein [Elusimicrobiota bacterium]
MKISSTKTNPKRTTILKDFVLILAITVFLFFLEYVFEAFEKLADFFLREKPKAVTELVAGLTIFTIVFAVFSISKWKRLRGALTKCERAEEKYHTIFEESKDAIYITTREGKIIDMNQSVLALFGYTKNEMIGMDVRKFYVNPVDRQKFQQEIEKNEFVREYEVKLCKKDGTEMDCLLTSTVWRSEDGSVAGYQGIIRDITERRQMAKMVRSMLDNVVMGISMISPKMEILWLNKTLKDWFPNVDVEKKPLCYQSFYLPPKKEICDYCPTIKAFETGRIHSAEMGICADGRIYNVIATPVKDEKGETIYVVETVEDITERKVSEEEVKRTGTYLESILNNSLDLIFTIKKDGTFGYINPQLEKVTGYKEKQIRGKYFIDFIPEQRKEFMLGKWKEINEGIAGKYETEIIRADGTLMDCLVSHSVLEGYDEFLVTLKDITERKRAEETLQESEERFRALSEAAFEGVVIHEQGKILELNQTLAKMFGYEREELIGRSGLDLVIPETRKAILEHMRSGSEKPYEGIGIKNDGTTFPIEICGRTTLYKGRVVRVGAIRDITERKRMEEELQRSYEKLQRTTMGTISAMAKVVEIRDPYT